MDSRPQRGEIYRHRNGGLYFIHGTGLLEKDITPIVVYSLLWDPDQLWVRPLEEFMDGRFTKLTKEDAL